MKHYKGQIIKYMGDEQTYNGTKLHLKIGKILKYNCGVFLVEFFEEVGGHNGCNLGRNYCCWWCAPDDLSCLKYNQYHMRKTMK